jgi:hypothetical protein
VYGRQLDDVPILWGDDAHDDRAILSYLLNGGAAYDVRSARMIVAPTLDHLPPGRYRMTSRSVPPVSHRSTFV